MLVCSSDQWCMGGYLRERSNIPIRSGMNTSTKASLNTVFESACEWIGEPRVLQRHMYRYVYVAVRLSPL